MKNSLYSGIYHNLPINEYHSDKSIGSSTLKTLATKTPLHLKEQFRKESAAFDFGTALHLAVLEPHKDQLIVCGPEDRRGNKWKELKEVCDAEGQLLLTSSDYEAVFAAKDSVFKNELAASLLSGKVEAEVSLFHQDEQTGLRCKIRPDIYSHTANVIIDLKTCVSASSHAFSKSIADYGYHIQCAFYERIWNEFHGVEINGFYFMAVEKEPPYAVAVYELDDESFLEGWEQALNAMRLYQSCSEKGVWNGYPSIVQKISLPQYAFKLTKQDSGISRIAKSVA